MTAEDFRQLLIKSAYDGIFPSAVAGKCFLRKDQTPHCPQRCVIGLCLPDEYYHSWLDDSEKCYEKTGTSDWEDRLDNFIWPRCNIPEGLTKTHLKKLQEIHDSHAMHSRWNPERFVEDVNNYFESFVNCNDSDE